MGFGGGGECRECGHPRAAHAGGGCRRCTCPGFTGERRGGVAAAAAEPREALAAYVAGVLRDDELERFVRAVARAHGLRPSGDDARLGVRRLVDDVPEQACAAYLAELRRREGAGEPLVR